MSEKTLLEFIHSFRHTASNRQEKYILGEANAVEVATLLELTGIDVSGFRRIIDNFGVRHAFKKHGRPETEEPRGQIAILPEDFEQIPDVVSFFDQIITEQSKKGLLIVRYEKGFEDFLLIYAEEIRFGQGELAFQTLYKRKIRKPWQPADLNIT